MLITSWRSFNVQPTETISSQYVRIAAECQALAVSSIFTVIFFCFLLSFIPVKDESLESG